MKSGLGVHAAANRLGVDTAEAEREEADAVVAPPVDAIEDWSESMEEPVDAPDGRPDGEEKLIADAGRTSVEGGMRLLTPVEVVRPTGEPLADMRRELGAVDSVLLVSDGWWWCS